MSAEHNVSLRTVGSWTVRPDRLKKSLEAEPIDPIDKVLVSGIIDNRRYRLTVVSFLAFGQTLPLEQRVGIALFVGLVNSADDIIDRKNAPHFSDPHLLEQHILSQPVVIKGEALIIGGNEITIGDLKDRTLQKFPLHKREAIQSFLDNALTIHAQPQLDQPTFKDAIAYREETSGAYTKIGAFLTEVTNAEDLTHIVNLQAAMQALDDAVDCFDDYRQGVMNPFIAKLFDNRETRALYEALKVPNKIMALRMLRKGAPKSREEYKQYYMEKVNGMRNGRMKTVIRGLGRLVL
jgi:hypothetical protein